MSKSSDVIKYGDVEKEKEIEKRLKELGLWGSKVGYHECLQFNIINITNSFRKNCLFAPV